MHRRGVDGRVHLQLDLTAFGYYMTPCSGKYGIPLYERLTLDDPLTCIVCAASKEKPR